MTNEKYIVIVIPESKKLNANLSADKVDKGKTSKTFTVGLSPTGNPPITARWCCWWMSDDEEKELKKDFKGNKDIAGDKLKDRVFDLREISPDQILNKLGLKTIKPEIRI